jgi:NAD(P)-dependent dehydrogenase (short-subunit alcohol dehydrogenase family)
VLGVHDPQKGEAAVEALRKDGIDARFLKLDVINRQDQTAAAKFLEQNFGRLDILINNAGINMDQLGTTHPSSTTDAVLQQTFDTNFSRQ